MAAREQGPVDSDEGLSKQRVVAEAVRLADREGVEGLSMRRLADALGAGAMSLYHYVANKDELLDAMTDAAEACGLGEEGLRRILYELPQGVGSRRRATGPCPLSSRELDVLRRLAEGKVYKQIAQELELSASTVRSHLHNVYGKLGALDRAQAVLMATDQGWI